MLLTLYYCNVLLVGSFMLLGIKQIAKELGSNIAAISAIVIMSVLWPLVYIFLIVYDLTIGLDTEDDTM